MRRSPIIFLLLLAMALGLMAGPHPCHATEAPKVRAMAEHASCHGTPASAPSKKADDCCDPAKGGHALCKKACQSTAVLIVAPAVPSALAFQELNEPVLEGPAAPFAFPIDHVPLV